MKQETLEKAKQLLQALESVQTVANDLNVDIHKKVGTISILLQRDVEEARGYNEGGSALNDAMDGARYADSTMDYTKLAEDRCNSSVKYLRNAIRKAEAEQQSEQPE